MKVVFVRRTFNNLSSLLAHCESSISRDQAISPPILAFRYIISRTSDQHSHGSLSNTPVPSGTRAPTQIPHVWTPYISVVGLGKYSIESQFVREADHPRETAGRSSLRSLCQNDFKVLGKDTKKRVFRGGDTRGTMQS